VRNSKLENMSVHNKAQYKPIRRVQRSTVELGAVLIVCTHSATHNPRVLQAHAHRSAIRDYEAALANSPRAAMGPFKTVAEVQWW
jgi:hypothetical protein